MSLSAADVTRRDDVFRCLPYSEKITGEACLSKQRGALDGTKSLAKCIGCGDGACIAEALTGVAPADLEERTPTTPAPPPVEQKEKPMSSSEERKAKQREYQRAYWLRKKAEKNGGVAPKAKPVSKPKAKPAARRQARSATSVLADTVSDEQLVAIAQVLGIDVDGLLRREIAVRLGDS